MLKEKYSGDARLDPGQLKVPCKNRLIFVAAQNDLFAFEVKRKDINTILDLCRKSPENRYFFQTKNPMRVIDFLDKIPKGSIIATTIETNRSYPWMYSAPAPTIRSYAMNLIHLARFETNVTIEPIMDFDLNHLVNLVMACNPSKVRIGADSKGHHLPEPSPDKLCGLIEKLTRAGKLFGFELELKSNLKRLLKK